MTAGEFAVGDEVTVRATTADDLLLTLRTHVLVVEVVQDEDGPAYVVAHPGLAARYGPFPADRLRPGWR